MAATGRQDDAKRTQGDKGKSNSGVPGDKGKSNYPCLPLLTLLGPLFGAQFQIYVRKWLPTWNPEINEQSMKTVLGAYKRPI